MHTAKRSSQIKTHTQSVSAKAGLLLTMESVRPQPAAAHEAKCLFHEYAGRAQAVTRRKITNNRTHIHTIIHDITPHHTQAQSRNNTTT